MLLPRLQPPFRAAITSGGRSRTSSNLLACLIECFSPFSIHRSSPSLSFVRHASHAQQGAVNKAKDGPGKRLGAKKSGEQYVIPGNIIFRQRGTHWFPGDNCAMGRDHTIYATESGYVKYYKDPEKHPKRQYIGVVFERDQILPLPRNSVRRRRLGMVTQKIETSVVDPAVKCPSSADTVAVEATDDGEVIIALDNGQPGIKKLEKGQERSNLTLRPGYMFREGNWEIGRTAERANIKVRQFKPRDRWAAWKKSMVRKAKAIEKRGLMKRTKRK